MGGPMMLNQHDFFKKLGVLQDDIKLLGKSDDLAVIEDTATRLEGFNYTPPVKIPVDQFLRCTTDQMLLEIDKIARQPDEERVSQSSAETEHDWERKLQHISILAFYYKELVALRNGVPEAWDEVDELYVHD